ncbi:MAG: PAS domain S-box protein [Caldilineaceae bacterium]
MQANESTPIQSSPVISAVRETVQQQFERLTANINGIVWEIDIKTQQFSFVSQQAERLLGYPREQWRGVDFVVDRLHPEDRQQVIDVAAQLIREQQSLSIEYRVLAADGQYVWLRDNVNVVVEEGQTTKLYGIMVDITGQKQTKAELSLFRILIDHINDCIEIIDPETERFVDCNEQSCRAHGYTRDEYLALSVADLDPLIASGSWQETWGDAPWDGPRVFESIHQRKDGSLFPVEVNINYVQLDRAYLIAVVRDITERKRAEQALIENHNLLNAVIEGTPDSVFIKDLKGRYVLINSAGSRLHDRTVESIIGKRDHDIFAHHTAEELIADDRHVIENNTSHAFEESIMVGGVMRTFLTTKSPRRDSDGNVIGIIGIARDITESKRLEEQLRQAQKMEAVGRLAGGIAHDFNNLLTVINGYSNMIFNRLQEEDPNRKRLTEIQKAGERAAKLTRQLLAFSRKQVLQSQVVNLNMLLLDLLSMLQRLIGEDIDLVLQPDLKLGQVKIDPGQFEQAIINLAINARDAMPQGGRLLLETRHTQLDETVIYYNPDIKPGWYAQVIIADSGQGMDEATQARIFEPFFTTKELGKGTGLGLAMVYGFVKQSGGHIEAKSELHKGTIFNIYLPYTDEVQSASTSLPDSQTTPQGSETILLVEDEDAVRTLCRQTLQACGYTVLEACNGPEAIELAQRHSQPIHLLVSDLVMPRMSGQQLAEVLTQARPDLRVLFMSGYTGETISRAGLNGTRYNLLQKPFDPSDLSRKVHEVLRTTTPHSD